MTLLAPIWLLGLVPLAALVVWLMTRRRERARVPFLELWKGPAAPTHAHRAFRPPPLAVICALAAIGLSLLGATRPRLWLPWVSSGQRATVILDRGITMSASVNGALRSARLRELAWPVITGALGEDRLDMVVLPGEPFEKSSFDTRDMLEPLVARRLAESVGPVIVLSDQRLPETHAQLIQIVPHELVQNVSIVRIGLVEKSRPQLMVRLRNQSSLQSAEIRVGGQVRQVELPERDAERDYFIDTEPPQRVVEVALLVKDDLPDDNVARLVRVRSWPRIETRAGVGDALSRMIEVYQRNRPADELSPTVVVAGSIFQLPPQQAGVAVCSPGQAREPATAGIGTDSDHPIPRSVDWSRVATDALAMPSPGEGWIPIVTSGRNVLVAVRTDPARQVWVGFDSPSFAAGKDFVIFWTNVFDWVGQSGATYTSGGMRQLSDEWVAFDSSALFDPRNPPPGVYARGEGALLALNALDVRFEPARPAESELQHNIWRGKLDRLAHEGGYVEAAPVIHLIALALLGAAGVLWSGQVRPRSARVPAA